MRLKKRLMEYVWRVQQAQMVISIVFWSLTLTGVFYPYVRERLLDELLGPERVALGIAVLFLVVLAAIVSFGLAYDRLRFWDEQVTVAQERNPYLYHGKVSPKEIVTWRYVADPSPENRELLLAMIEDNIDRDPRVREALEIIEERLQDRIGRN